LEGGIVAEPGFCSHLTELYRDFSINGFSTALRDAKIEINRSNDLSAVASTTVSTESFSASYIPAILQLGNTLLMYFASIALMFYLTPISYLYSLPLLVSATIAHVRLFMIGHDCSHRSFLPARWENIVVGNFIGVLTNTPLLYWGSQHAMHHRTTGNLDRRGTGDVVTWTVDEYLNAGRMARLWYRINRNPWILMFIFAPIHFIVLQRIPLEKKSPSIRIWRSVMGTNLGMCAYYGLLIWLFGLKTVLLVYVPVLWMSSVIAVWLFYIQHQFDTAYWEREADWNYEDATLKGSSFYDLPKWLHWATGNIGYHNVHHLNPRVPNYRLADYFESVPEFRDVKTIRLAEGFRFANLALWDESGKRMVSLGALENSPTRL
jgi:omega-6 fatty acid desaturase (delta-12 desaturase)